MSLKWSFVWIAATLVLYFVFAFVFGMRSERGRAMQRENTALTREVFNARAAADELRELALSIQIEHIASLERLNAIASDFEVSREQQQSHFTRQRAALAALLARRPDLDTPVGADVLRHWQAGNTGPDGDGLAGESPAAASGGIDAAVPTAADAGGGNLGGIVGESRCGDGAVSPVPDDAAPLDRSGQYVGTDGTADVLCRPETGRANGGDVR